ncbi:hypothetical protein BCR34DRAFT_609954 [Clohesyomyces aquaticus]|uniref:Uncharacterized protein n=1 Tax=Clohesyomyces aquaticus TaxID=1231657 RepID=A0A1Y2A8X8_9PLEO|nr:hypothetical protein BCR34DRAFT_609954 [Clohesyomyces aquaticus]
MCLIRYLYLSTEMLPNAQNPGKIVASEVEALPLEFTSRGHILDAYASGTEFVTKYRRWQDRLPSDEKDDPLNWSKYKKHVLLFVVSAASFLLHFTSAIGAVALVPQSVQYDRSTACCAAPTNFENFMFARIINGFFSTVAQGRGLIFINDIFFVYKHTRKINIWSAFIIEKHE